MMKQLTRKFIKEEKGAPIIEIVILIAMAAVIAAVLFPNLRKAVGTWFNDMLANVQSGLTGQDASGGAQVSDPDADASW